MELQLGKGYARHWIVTLPNEQTFIQTVQVSIDVNFVGGILKISSTRNDSKNIRIKNLTSRKRFSNKK